MGRLVSTCYVTTFCNCAHRVSDGKPVNHACYIIPPAALEAERSGDTKKAIGLIEEGKTYLQFDMPSLPPHKGVKG